MRWIIQDNLYNERGYIRFIEALDRLDQEYTTVKVVPFAHELIPDVDFGPSEKIIVMGSDSLIKAAQRKNWWPGAFTNNNFNHNAWVKAHGCEMLNCDALTAKFRNVQPPASPFFIRPLHDFKIFAGTVVTPENFLSWQEKAIAYGGTSEVFDFLETEVVVSSVKDIQQEYRFFVVNSQIVAYSSYKIGTRVIPSMDVDKDVHWYVIGIIQTWEPDYAYVIDIAKTPDGFKIIEYNCINASGFYAADCQSIVSSLSRLVSSMERDKPKTFGIYRGARGIQIPGNIYYKA